MYRLGVPDKTIQAILRHSNVNVTLGYYVKSSGRDVLAGMNKLEDAAETLEKSAVHRLRDTNGTVKPDSGATPEFLN